MVVSSKVQFWNTECQDRVQSKEICCWLLFQYTEGRKEGKRKRKIHSSPSLSLRYDFSTWWLTASSYVIWEGGDYLHGIPNMLWKERSCGKTSVNPVSLFLCTHCFVPSHRQWYGKGDCQAFILAHSGITPESFLFVYGERNNQPQFQLNGIQDNGRDHLFKTLCSALKPISRREKSSVNKLYTYVPLTNTSAITIRNFPHRYSLP